MSQKDLVVGFGDGQISCFDRRNNFKAPISSLSRSNGVEFLDCCFLSDPVTFLSRERKELSLFDFRKFDKPVFSMKAEASGQFCGVQRVNSDTVVTTLQPNEGSHSVAFINVNTQ